MTLSNAKTDGMKYEVTGSRKVNNKQMLVKAAGELNTSSLVWLLVKRHKIAILAAGNVVLVLNTLVPEWPTIVRSLVQ